MSKAQPGWQMRIHEPAHRGAPAPTASCRAQRILDAATEIAAERGYEGTSIALVSTKCGLPPSSIYWHFKDKDDLIAAVIERSFAAVAGGMELPAGRPPGAMAFELGTQIAKALLDAPDFIRLGLMLALEHRPVEPRARAMFLQVRDNAFHRFARDCARRRSWTR